MRRLLITGASGYIGQRLCEIAVKRGVEVIVLGSAPSTFGATRAITWCLGEAPPPDVFEDVTAVVHLAHSWASDLHQRSLPSNLNLFGSKILARASFVAGVPRFVLASTTSARSQALNAYGRVKHALEAQLLALPEAAGRVICARIGLVYGGPELGLYGQLSKLVRLTPLLPMIGLDRKVQPIHLDEVVAGLLALAMDPLPRREGSIDARYVLAGPVPMTFGNWLRVLRRAHTGKSMLLFPMPMWTALLACEVSRFMPFIPTIDRERVLGLAGTMPMDSATDLATLHIETVGPMKRLVGLRSERRRNIAEALAMLSYVSGQSIPPKAAVIRLIRGIERADARSLGLPWFVLKCPALLRVFEPLPPHPAHRFAQRLHLAAMVMESVRNQCRRRQGIVFLFGEIVLEIIAVPFRLVLGQRYA